MPKGRRLKAEVLDFDFGYAPSTTPMTHPRVSTWVTVQQSLTFYNDFYYSSRIKVLYANESDIPVYSSDNRMMISLWLRSNDGHRGFKLEFTSDEPTICVGDLNGDEGTIQSPRNISTYYCEYQRDPSLPFIRDSEDRNVGTIGIYITEIVPTSPLVCIILSPIHVQYLPLTRQRIFTRQCNSTHELPMIASPFREVKVGTKKGGYYADVQPYNINYKVHNCGRLIRDTQEASIRSPTFASNYGRVSCAWQYTTVDNAPIGVSVALLDFRILNRK